MCSSSVGIQYRAPTLCVNWSLNVPLGLVVKVEVSSESHSYYTGKQKIVDTAGRVEKFKRRYTKKADKKAE